MTSQQLRHLKDELQQIDARLAGCRGPASPEQMQLLRLRRECLVRIRDAERASWGD
ncbi:hypothetical protein [Synechococcus sp. ROS8604]|uniref:hypothetical protein n=1 Tax=Synechococcus sp. ROS8604 TaxID=1442557 RepID=UPI0016489251|nr:hypothetical protein [Synechococcus sp. ROS8604]QNI89557.1 hypothetical protein SynROS8604_02941 [Synechococcus sp. ROS8604]